MRILNPRLPKYTPSRLAWNSIPVAILFSEGSWLEHRPNTTALVEISILDARSSLPEKLEFGRMAGRCDPNLRV
jgi:hypothetical protein